MSLKIEIKEMIVKSKNGNLMCLLQQDADKKITIMDIGRNKKVDENTIHEIHKKIVEINEIAKKGYLEDKEVK
jgi:hypothetical protein